MKLIRLPLALLSSRSLEGVLLAAMLIVLGTAAYRMFSVPGKENAITVRLLAELGSAEAQSRMGVMMAERGNTEEAEEWLLRSVRNGGKSGIPELGRLYLESQSAEKRAEGLSILLRAAGHGSRKARYLLARHSELNGEKLPCYVWNALALDRDAVSDAEPYVVSEAEKGRTRCSENFSAEDYRKAEAVLNGFLRITGNAPSEEKATVTAVEPDGGS